MDEEQAAFEELTLSAFIQDVVCHTIKDFQ